MKYLLLNVYCSEVVAPYVVSSKLHATHKDATEEMRKTAEDALVNEYNEEAYPNEDDISTDVSYNDYHITGPDFHDWWTIIELRDDVSKGGV